MDNRDPQRLQPSLSTGLTAGQVAASVEKAIRSARESQ